LGKNEKILGKNLKETEEDMKCSETQSVTSFHSIFQHPLFSMKKKILKPKL